VFPKVTLILEEYGDFGDQILACWQIERDGKTVETMATKNDLYQDGEVFLPAITWCINASLEELFEELNK